MPPREVDEGRNRATRPRLRTAFSHVAHALIPSRPRDTAGALYRWFDGGPTAAHPSEFAVAGMISKNNGVQPGPCILARR